MCHIQVCMWIERVGCTCMWQKSPSKCQKRPSKCIRVWCTRIWHISNTLATHSVWCTCICLIYLDYTSILVYAYIFFLQFFYMHTHMYASVCTSITHMYASVCTSIPLYVHPSICMHTCTHTFTYMHTHSYLCMTFTRVHAHVKRDLVSVKRDLVSAHV